MPDIYEEIIKLKADGQTGALVTITAARGSTPREAGAKMLVRADGTMVGTIGGGSLEGEAIRLALEALREEKPRTLHYDLSGTEAGNIGMICGGVVDVYIEPIVPKPEVLIFGGGHISLYLAKISAMVGFQVTVIDDRPEFANRERFPEAEEVVAEEFPRVLGKRKVHRGSYLVIVTRGHASDQEVLEWAVGTEALYIGMIGSRRKIQTVYENLRKNGIPAEKLARVHAPIGLDIGALTPEEIAVSIVAEMIQVRRGKKGVQMISAIVLAAGEAKRMGQTKQLIELQGKPLLQHVLDSLLASQVDEVILVLGHDADKILKTLCTGEIKIVINPAFREGMSTSIRQGLFGPGPEYPGLFYLLGDQPGIGKEVVNRLIREFEGHFPEKSIIVPAYRGSQGHPVLIQREIPEGSFGAQGDIGCRPLLANHPEDLLTVEVDTEAVLADIDTPEDLAQTGRAKPLEEPK